MLNKIQQIHPLFINITSPLKSIANIILGYMKIFKNGSYYTIMEDLECLIQFVTHVEKSSIFCERNVTNCFDKNYNFTLWPKDPSCIAMDMGVLGKCVIFIKICSLKSSFMASIRY